ncbi:MAG: hypothetical protein ACOYLP_03740 [Flavobacterium sp.]|uniref:hypothetical protein n=1 Tax=Flavobacterium sp. TaxID=239 RepID=UPI003BDC015F
MSDVLTIGSCYVFYFYGDCNVDFSYYDCYNFNFNSNGTCTAIKNAITTNGDCDLYDESSY